MPGTTTPSASTARAPSHITNLLAELHHADHIIKTMLRAMTVQQQARVGAQLEAAGVAGEGMTRHHERAAVIAAATAAPASATTGTAPELLDIEAQAVDVLTQADHADILLRLLFERLDQEADTMPAGATINCLATCTARTVELMREAGNNIVALVAKGGAK
ncbi:hypothetical protein [Duganella sp. BuS-21]|uniref:hypothetical protein n=1 Tax=Duganella sp. BuS-21 TaxID=2943848 RepID=UPI0035A5AA6D